jgi:acyl-CoA synthetase (AMP-forming)/AMP-acid ligase II
VVLADNAELDKRSIAVHIKSKLEPHKVPTYYESVESIQRTYNGKLDRKYYKTNTK